MFSCVVPVKGQRPYMDEALASLRSQGIGADLEIIVQDGDEETDSGQSDALNKGFSKAKGEWLFWLNADDVLLPGALKKVKTAIHSTATTPRIAPATQLASLGGYSNSDSLQWIAGNLVYIDGDGRCLKRVYEHGNPSFYRGLPVRVYGPSSFFRRELLEKAGGFDASLRYMMDTDLWCRFRKLGYWYQKIPDCFWGFRVWGGSLTSGDLTGDAPDGMKIEQRELEQRYEIRFECWRKRALQLSRLLDGSYLKSCCGTIAWRGKRWQDCR